MNNPPGPLNGPRDPQSSWSTSGPVLPLNARDGEILQYRDGEWIAVSPLEALQVLRDPRILDGVMHAEFLDGFTVVARPRGKDEAPPPVESPTQPTRGARPSGLA